MQGIEFSGRINEKSHANPVKLQSLETRSFTRPEGSSGSLFGGQKRFGPSQGKFLKVNASSVNLLPDLPCTSPSCAISLIFDLDLEYFFHSNLE